jgi:hypothetical protein
MEDVNEIEQKTQQINDILGKLDNKEFRMYFFVLDTQGNPTAGIANIYEHVKVLRDLGYDACIMHEKDEYHGVGEWLGAEYAELPHASIQSELNVKAEDMIIIPEIFSNVMHDVRNFPCRKVVFCQSYHYILELLNVGARWTDYGFFDVITTSETQATYIKKLFPQIRTHVTPVSIPEYFKTTDKLKMPVISLVTREQSDALKIVKSFYLQYPTYKWVTFRELRGMPREYFAQELGKSCLAIWVDEVSGYGTFPIEAMECETPVIGVIPSMLPEWMVTKSKDDGGGVELKNNGIWTDNLMNIPELVATYIKLWLEDSVPTHLLEGMEEERGKHTTAIQKTKIEEVFTNIIDARSKELAAIIPVAETEDTVETTDTNEKTKE